MKKKSLSPEQAYQAMALFLEDYYKRTQGKAEVGDVLGDIQLNSVDGKPADPAMWEDWISAIKLVLQQQTGAPERPSVRTAR